MADPINPTNQPKTGAAPQVPPTVSAVPPAVVKPAQTSAAIRPTATLVAATPAMIGAQKPAVVAGAIPSAATPGATGASSTPAKPATPLPGDQSKSKKNFVLGCLGFFGCSLLVFVVVIFAFLGMGSTDSPIFKFLGVPSGSVVNVLITLVNLFFLVLVFISFIAAVVGVFRITTAKKDDKETRKKGSVLAFGSLGIMVFLIVIWIFAYFFLAQKQTTSPKLAIATEPVSTINLTAPVTISFDASKAPIATAQYQILSYNWDFGDKATAVGNPQSHTYEDIGSFTVRLIISTKEKATGKEKDFEFTRDVTIANALPKIVIKATVISKDKSSTKPVTYDGSTTLNSPEITGFAPLTIAFDALLTTAPNGEISDFSWDLNGDGKYTENDSPVWGKAEFTYNEPGTYNMGIQVTDSNKAQVEKAGAVIITVKPPDLPTAVMKIEGVDGTELRTATPYLFSGADSTTPEGTIEKYHWDFGDGSKADTRSATHSFKESGKFEIVLSVTNSNKKTGETRQTYDVKTASAAPLVSLKTTPEATNGLISGKAPLSVIFDASGSKDSNNDIIEYSWDFDGDAKTDDANAVTSHTFTKTGTFNVTLTVNDATNLSTKAQVVVKVDAADLKADITADPIAGPTPLTVNFDASGSTYPSGKIVSYEWDFGDASPKRVDTSKVSYQYTKIGTFTARVTAITADGKRASSEILINVRPVSLRACFDSSVSTGKGPLDVEFDPTCSSGTVVKYSWNFAGLGVSSDRKPKFTFKDPGTYDITLQVFDSQNVTDSFTKKITVTAP